MTNQSTTMQGITITGIGLLWIIIIYSIIPILGSEIDQVAVLPGDGVGSAWNSSVNTDVPTAVSIFIILSNLIM